MYKEFRDFIARGNVIDLAVGVIIGAAFGKIVTTLVEGILMPPLGLVLGRVDFSSLFFVLDSRERRAGVAGRGEGEGHPGHRLRPAAQRDHRLPHRGARRVPAGEAGEPHQELGGSGQGRRVTDDEGVLVLRLDDLDQGEALPAVHLAAVTRARLRPLVASVLAALGLLYAPAAGGQSAPPAMKVIGYYADWTAARYPLADIPAAKLTHVNYAFAKIGPDNRLTWNASAALEQVYPGDCAEPGCPHGLFNQITLVKRRHPHLKFLLSVGGWTDSGPFYEMAASEATRDTFAQSCAALPEDVSAVRRHRHRLGTPGLGRTPARQPARCPQLRAAARRHSQGDRPGRLLTVAAQRQPARHRPARVCRDGGDPRLGQRDDLRLPQRRHARRIQLGALQPRRSDQSPAATCTTRCRPSPPRACRRTSSSPACRSTAVAGREWNRRTSGVPAPARCASAATASSPRHSSRRRATSAIGTTSPRCRGCTTPTRRSGLPTRIHSRCASRASTSSQQKLAGAMFWELSNDDGTLLDALRSGLGLGAPSRGQ